MPSSSFDCSMCLHTPQTSMLLFNYIALSHIFYCKHFDVALLSINFHHALGVIHSCLNVLFTVKIIASTSH